MSKECLLVAISNQKGGVGKSALTVCGQCFTGETLEAKGVVEEHGDQKWLIVGTTREAHGEYIVSRTLLDA